MIKVNIFFGFKLFVTVTILTTQLPMQATALKHDAGPIVNTTTKKIKLPKTLVKTDFTSSSLPNEMGIREVNFLNDLGEVVELDLVCQHHSLGKREEECLAHFRQIPITIRAEKEYRVNDGDEANIETKKSWELSIQKISNEALLSLKTFRDIVLDHFLPKRPVSSFMDEWVWKPALSIYQKVVAPMLKVLTHKEATTTIIIHTDIEPHYESIRCSDIILDLDKLNSENKLDIKVEHDDEWTMRVTVSQKMNGSLPNTFF